MTSPYRQVVYFHRLRQFKALGLQQTEVSVAAGVAGASAEVTDEEGAQSRLPEPCSIQQRNCEAETLRVFRLITGQVMALFLSPRTLKYNNEDLNTGQD